ncbi:MAG: alkene reductase [Pseudomonadota bacterium]
MSANPLFASFDLGPTPLSNRVVMAPMTRGRAHEDHVPTDIMPAYYAERAGAGLIVTEATGVNRTGLGWYRAPGIWTDAQAEAWKPVTDAVHAEGGRIFLQLWHMGRVVLPFYLDGERPVGPSEIAADGKGFVPAADGSGLAQDSYAVPKAMKQSHIRRTVDDYAAATRRAMAVGFDGVEIHGANGYLIDQFLRDGSNRRQDDYGGTLANRLRFLKEVVAGATAEAGADRTSLRISPTNGFNDMTDSNPAALTAAIGQVAEDAGLAYVHLIEPINDGFMRKPEKPVLDDLKRTWTGPVMLNGGYERDSARADLENGKADLIAVGRPFIANPDLVHRWRQDLPEAEGTQALFYYGGENGYSDYPAFDEEKMLAG